ncbi:MAG: hypothetical protein R6W48_11070 [Gaiellaceae bacterium]
MNTVALFAYGTLVTLIVVFGIGLLVWGAILDGRYEREVRARVREAADEDLEIELGANSALSPAQARD